MLASGFGIQLLCKKIRSQLVGFTLLGSMDIPGNVIVHTFRGQGRTNFTRPSLDSTALPRARASILYSKPDAQGLKNFGTLERFTERNSMLLGLSLHYQPDFLQKSIPHRDYRLPHSALPNRQRSLELTVYMRQPRRGNSSSYGARPVYQNHLDH